ncbi:MAG TPA: NADH-quinone oxidoreductase subunit H [Bacteroidales bacterium]|nr:NADH-quinone oxidoreductase subunit H [Bacteroidales bacterium]HOK98486.1 NADH-quinone oxidoreductase subunit H [Bacteroidales bacterium]HPO66084.1 NADH-quinone oxidoreductase subunit H [Bacteroidales bacterium]
MVSTILIVLVSLIFGGIIIRTKSILSGRKGPGMFQPMHDIIRLFRKGSVYSYTSSFITQIAPLVYFSSVVIATLFIPFGQQKGVFSFQGDFILFAYLLTVGKFMMIVAALDSGSSFEGMGASREVLFSALIEPAFFITMGSFTLLSGKISLAEIFANVHYNSHLSYFIGFLAAIILMLIAMVENSRMPVDDPKTHLELTMIHEVMILDYSGFDLGLILYTTYLKFAMYGALIANFFIGQLPLVQSIAVFLGIQVLFAIMIGIIESFMARFRMNHNPQYILILSSLSLLIFLGILMFLGKII